MIDLYYYPSPNAIKIGIMLEECALTYRVRPVDITAGEQFAPDFLAISPNNKVPAIVDLDFSPPLGLFESGAILTYLADKCGRFLPTEGAARYQALAWLNWQVAGLGPMAGQAHHFRAFAPEVVPYAIKRYTDEVNRLYGVLNTQLTEREFVAGEYSIADMAIYPWIRSYERQGQDLAQFPNVARWFEVVARRPAVERALTLGAEKMAPKESYGILYGQRAR
jgi:GST-like protein